MNFYYIPTSANATTLGYTLPSGVSWAYPATNTCPTLTIGTTFGNLLGLNAGTYGTGSINNQNYSIKTPNISPINAYVFTANLINNIYSMPLPNLFFTVPLTNSLGGICEDKQPQLVWNDIYSSTYYYIEIRLYDQDMNVLNFNDTDMVITIALDKTKNNPNYIK